MLVRLEMWDYKIKTLCAFIYPHAILYYLGIGSGRFGLDDVG